MKADKQLWFSFIMTVAFLTTFYSCSADTSGASCETDQQCPNGQYCGEDKVCHKGTKPIKDAGPDGGTDAGRDAGKDAGKDAETDTASDISEDILTDAGEDTISEDTGIDTGEDAVTDISEDTGKDTSVNTYIPSVYDMSAGIIKTDKYQIRTVTGTSARPVIETKEIKVYNTKKQRSKK